MVYLIKKRRLRTTESAMTSDCIPLHDVCEPQPENEGQDHEDRPNSSARSEDQSDFCQGKSYIGNKDLLKEFAGCPIDYCPEPAQEGKNALSSTNPWYCTSGDT